MTLVNGVWYDNKLKAYPKEYDGVGSDYVPTHLHLFGMGKNDDDIPIVVCLKCKFARMYIMAVQFERLEYEELKKQ